MKLHISHHADDAASAHVVYALQKVRVRALTNPRQTVLDWTINVTGGKNETGYLDHYGNHVDLCSLQSGGQSLTISASGTVETMP